VAAAIVEDAGMRAIVFAAGRAGTMPALTESRPEPMLPLMDRPFLQHVVECLVDLGVQQFDFVLSERPDQIEQHFGDGKRWGCEIRYYLARDGAAQYRTGQVLPPIEGKVLVAHGDRLPLVPAGALDSATPAMVETENGWAGWALVDGAAVAQLASARDEGEAEAMLREAAPGRVQAGVTLDIRDYRGYLAAHDAILHQQFPLLLLTGRQASEQIWISRNVSIHPTAKLTAPLFVGENCRIAEGVQLGPGAVVGANSALDQQSSVREAVVLPGSYVGESLDLERSIVDQGRLVNVELGAELAIGDEFLLGSMAGKKPRARWARMAGRLFAIGVLLVLWPVVLLTALILAMGLRAAPFQPERFVVLPAAEDPDRWRTSSVRAAARARSLHSAAAHFILRFLPGLPAVALGRLALVGVEPRAPETVQALPADWRSLYLQSKAGLRTEAFVQYGSQASANERYACEAFYAVSAGFRLDLSILTRYMASIWGFGKPRAQRRYQSAGERR